MADALSSLGPLASSVGYWVIIVAGGLMFIAFCAIIAYVVMNARRYKKFKALIFKRNKEGQLVYVGMSKAAIIKNKLKKYIFHLKNYKVEMGENMENPDGRDIPSIPNENGGEVVFLERLGKRHFIFLEPIGIEGQIKARVTEEDVAEAVRTYDINAKYYGGQEWQKWIAPAMFIVTAMIIVILIAIVLNKFEVIKEVAIHLENTAGILKDAALGAKNSGVAVVG